VFGFIVHFQHGQLRAARRVLCRAFRSMIWSRISRLPVSTVWAWTGETLVTASSGDESSPRSFFASLRSPAWSSSGRDTTMAE
jgi:hypothetical protein